MPMKSDPGEYSGSVNDAGFTVEHQRSTGYTQLSIRARSKEAREIVGRFH